MAKKARSRRFVDEATATYAVDKPLYEELGGKVRELLAELLKQEGIAFHTIEHRTKAMASLAEKLTRPTKTYKNGLADIKDLCGLRIITYTLSDVKRVCALVESEFAIARQHTVDKAALLEPSEFGYRSTHFVVQVSSSRTALAEWKRFANMQAEIQVRTVLEHAWAAIDHALRYKRDEDVPRQQKRTLYRLSALLEMADESFDSLKEKQEDLRREASRRIQAGSAESPPLDSVTYPLYAQSSEALKELMQIALASGFADAKDYEVADEEDMSESRSATQSELIALAKAQGIQTVRELEAALRAELRNAEEFLGAQIEAAGYNHWYVTPDFLALLCMIRRDQNITVEELVTRAGWGRESAERVLSVVAKMRRPTG
jgi:putative GTP pyrophosphokinase